MALQTPNTAWCDPNTNYTIAARDRKDSKKVVILGAGLAGLAAGYTLSAADQAVLVLEADSTVGGLAKTIRHHGFRFDLGGHRFFTTNRRIDQFVKDVLNDDFLVVPRKSKIYLLNRYFDYPLRPANVIFGLNTLISLRIIGDYLKERVKQHLKAPDIITLEDWIVNRFGRTMFNLYFKQYSKKVCGIESGKISREWGEQRIRDLSLWTAVKRAFSKADAKDIATLADQFIYPPLGIGQISERLREAIEQQNRVLTKTTVAEINHEDFFIKNVIVKSEDQTYKLEGSEFVSSIPLTNFIKMIRPSAPEDVIKAAARLKFRNVVTVTIMLNRDRVTDNTWIYFPEKEIPFGRIHEPVNWSPLAAPKGKTHLVLEYFCFKGDKLWGLSDDQFVSMSLDYLEKLDFMHKKEMIDSCVVRVPNAYPLFELDYRKYYIKVLKYLESFKNLHIIGRVGLFKYYNMDHAIESGTHVAETILERMGVEKCEGNLIIGA
jgi:protoporphyrinogen oxidase